MSQYTGHAGVLWDAGRCYNMGDANEAIDTYKCKRILYSPTDVAQTVSAVTAELNRLRTRAANAGITGFTIHYTPENESDREHLTQTAIDQYIATVKVLSPAVRAIPGCTFWMNITRWGLTSGGGRVSQKFFLGPEWLDGYAVNCYDPRRGSTTNPFMPYSQFLDDMFDEIAVTGVSGYDCWETGSYISNLNGGRPAYMAGLARYLRDRAAFVGMTCHTVCYWDSKKSGAADPTTDTRFELDGTATRTAWRAAFT